MGLIGGAVGALVGREMGRGGIGTEVFGASIGAAAGIPVGVHLANGSRGNLLQAEIASVGLGAALFLAAGPSKNAVPILLLSPLGSLAVSVAIEARTSRGRRGW